MVVNEPEQIEKPEQYAESEESLTEEDQPPLVFLTDLIQEEDDSCKPNNSHLETCKEGSEDESELLDESIKEALLPEITEPDQAPLLQLEPEEVQAELLIPETVAVVEPPLIVETEEDGEVLKFLTDNEFRAAPDETPLDVDHNEDFSPADSSHGSLRRTSSAKSLIEDI